MANLHVCHQCLLKSLHSQGQGHVCLVCICAPTLFYRIYKLLGACQINVTSNVIVTLKSASRHPATPWHDSTREQVTWKGPTYSCRATPCLLQTSSRKRTVWWIKKKNTHFQSQILQCSDSVLCGLERKATLLEERELNLNLKKKLFSRLNPLELNFNIIGLDLFFLFSSW